MLHCFLIYDQDSQTILLDTGRLILILYVSQEPLCVMCFEGISALLTYTTGYKENCERRQVVHNFDFAIIQVDSTPNDTVLSLIAVTILQESSVSSTNLQITEEVKLNRLLDNRVIFGGHFSPRTIKRQNIKHI